ncbi:hypothetical protein [Pseudooceanicola sp.]|uniref:hypothetical protein n=1 Tax=Pseudooceanicola sp. TaxID=1914328 RepID=UPI0035C69116
MKLTTSLLTLTLLTANTASAGSHTPEEAALDDVMSGCIRIVAQDIPPMRALPGAQETDGKWLHVTDVSTTTYDPGQNTCLISLPSMSYDQDASEKFVRNEMLGADITDLESMDIGRTTRGIIGKVNEKWVHIGYLGMDGGPGSMFVVKANH